MLVADFLEMLLADTAEEGRQAALFHPDPLGWGGTLRGLEECRTAMLARGEAWDEGGMATRLRSLLDDAGQCTRLAGDSHEAWYWLSREATVEWVASVASAAMVAHGLRPVLSPSRAAVEEAVRLAGA